MYGIDLRREPDPLFKKVEISNKPIVISPLNGKNITDSCFEFGKIKELFKALMELIKDIDKVTKKEHLSQLKTTLFKMVFGG